MSVLLGLLFLAIAIGIGIWYQRKAALANEDKVPLTAKLKLPSALEGIFVHPGHAWVKVVDPSLIAVGSDEFTGSVFGSVEKISLPQLGSRIHQGEKVWKLKRGERELSQSSPISGTVVAVNQELVGNPNLLVRNNSEKNWLLKIRPDRLKVELQNLLHGTVLNRWNQAIKDQLVATLTTAEFPVLQEGGEIIPGLGNELTSEQWKKINKEFFDSAD